MKKLLAVISLVVVLMFSVTQVQAACTQAITTQAKEMMMQGAFTIAHTYKVALYTTAGATLGASTTAYTASGEITGTNYAAGGASTVAPAITASSTTALWDFTTNVAWTSTTQTADCALLYDSSINNSTCSAAGTPWVCCTGNGTGTCTNAAVMVMTFTSTSSTNGTWTLQWPSAGASTSLMRIN